MRFYRKEYRDSDFIHINKNSTVILWSHHLVELLLDISWSPEEKITKVWTGFWNFWSLNEIASFTWSKLWDSFRVLWWNLKSITSECRDLHISIMHFYEKLKKNEWKQKIEWVVENVKGSLPI